MSKDRKGEEELAELLEQQRKARREEIFGGFTKDERAAYDARSNRIDDLKSAALESRRNTLEGKTKAAKQRNAWNKHSETDTPQNEARQPYGSREHDSFSATKKKSKTKKTESDQSPDT